MPTLKQKKEQLKDMFPSPRPDTTGITPTKGMTECLKCIIWAQQNCPEEVDVFWEDLAIMINDLPTPNTH